MLSLVAGGTIIKGGNAQKGSSEKSKWAVSLAVKKTEAKIALLAKP